MSAFLDELAEWVASAQRRRKESLVAFLAVRSDIEEAMRAGYALKTVWAHLRETGRIACRYETFCAHVRRHMGTSKNLGPLRLVKLRCPDFVL